MLGFPPTIILRHRRENLKKCSLKGLETRSDCRFFTYPKDQLPNLSSYVLLALDAPVLTEADQNKGIFIIDGTWRYAAQMEGQLERPQLFERRSLPPGFQTAYPRRQEDCPEPNRGLASVEALFIAYSILGRDTTGLLDHYYWGEDFLKKYRYSLSLTF